MADPENGPCFLSDYPGGDVKVDLHLLADQLREVADKLQDPDLSVHLRVQEVISLHEDCNDFVHEWGERYHA